MNCYHCMDNKVWRHMVRCSCLPVTDTFCSFSFYFFFFIFIVEFLSGQIPPYQILFGGWNPFRNPACLPPSCRRNNTYFIFIFYFLPLQKGEEGVKWKGQNCRSWNSVCPLSSPCFKSKRCVFSPSGLPSRFHYCPTPPLIWARVGGHARWRTPAWLSWGDPILFSKSVGPNFGET